MADEAMEFVVAFLKYYDEKGIADHFDKSMNRMVTSTGVGELVAWARKLAPAKLKPGEAAKAMNELEEEQRDEAIKGSDKVIDLRAQFSKKIAENGGARGLLAQLVECLEKGATMEGLEVLRNAKTFVDAEKGSHSFVQTEEVPPKA